jgi:isoleucyl-tRNA synthetase
MFMSVFLPKTGFNLHSGKDLEKKLLQFWNEIELEKLRRIKNKSRKKFILHDGPPYANGDVHLGHAENKIWKDFLNKFFWQHGYSVEYYMGWDGHGLPIENAIEKQLKADGVDKKQFTRAQFWDKCYDFAYHWMQTQQNQFKQLGVFSDYSNYYSTFFEEESLGIIKCIHDFVREGLLERRYRPILWSYVEKTALAYAEVEYKDKAANSVYIKFPIIETDIELLKGASVVVWTTTPWTLPANVAVAYNKQFSYCIIETNGQKYCLLEEAVDRCGFVDYQIIDIITGDVFSNTYLLHPIKEFAFHPKKPMLNSDHVKSDAGTGFVHIAPAHGEDDFELCKKNDITIEDLLDQDACFLADIPLVGGQHVKDADAIMLAKLGDSCIKHEKMFHSCAHSWRSKAPLIYRLTKQWFLDMTRLKQMAFDTLEQSNTNWIPEEGKNRFCLMLAARDDWCISRQRIWGVPIAIFYNKITNEVLSDQSFLDATLDVLKRRGVKEWWALRVSDIDSSYKDCEWERVDDIVDIWFESGATQFFVLQKRNEFPADVYLEGSDQHRGWFSSSLLISALQTGRTPWKNLITHGFCLDANKQKMSKSIGNVVNPLEWNIDELRLFFLSQNLCDDIFLNEHSARHSKDMLFRFKNTLKYILGILAIEENKHDVHSITLFDSQFPKYDAMPPLEKWLLHNIFVLNEEYLAITSSFRPNKFINKLYEFCQIDLSAFYFDVRKDAVYCESQSNDMRKIVISCFKILADSLLSWLSVFIPFSAEEIWGYYINENYLQYDKSIHLMRNIQCDSVWQNHNAFEFIENLRMIRKRITEEIEELRVKKIVSASQEVEVIILPDMCAAPHLEILREISLVSSIKHGDTFHIYKSSYAKCSRCRFAKALEDSSDICMRCANVQNRREAI